MSSSNLQNAVRGVPKPPQPPKAKEFRNFVRLEERRVYLLDGVVYNPNPRDTRENHEKLVGKYLEEGKPKYEAIASAYQDRFDEFGISKEHGFFEEEVKPWFPGNVAVLLKPIKHKHTLQYEAAHGETINNAVMKILLFTQNLIEISTNPEAVPFKEDPVLCRVEIPGYGYMYGSYEANRAEMVAFILSCHGRVVGQRADGEYITELITEDEIIEVMPPGFVNYVVDEEDGCTVFDEVLHISTLFNLDLIKEEMEKDQAIEEDDLKNSTNSSRTSATRSSAKKRSKTATAESE